MNTSKTKNDIDIVYASNDGYRPLLDNLINYGNTNIIDFEDINSSEICNFTRYACKNLPKKECILLVHLTEAFSSVYWNIVLDILQNDGYKKVVWVDGGLTPGYMLRHTKDLTISHKTSTYFFTRLLNEKSDTYNDTLEFKQRIFHFLSLGRFTRMERVYFTNKILDDPDLYGKGIVSCGWGGNDKNNIWQDNHNRGIAEKIVGKNIDKFPISLGDVDDQQYDLLHDFDLAVYNIVQESSIGFNSASHLSSYSTEPFWNTIESDRHFFTEKTAKAFLMGQVPLFIATPGYVEELRKLGFDMFDDVVNHEYDKEDFVLLRCKRVYQELKRLSLQDITQLNYQVKKKLMKRLQNNLNLLKKLGNEKNLEEWINNQIA